MNNFPGWDVINKIVTVPAQGLTVCKRMYLLNLWKEYLDDLLNVELS